MFNKNLAMAVKVEGKVLREIDGKVYLPFGCEYTLYFKNTSTRRVKIKVTVDGQDAMDGAKLIVNANSTAELKRFMKNGNLNEGNSFRFIEKTSKISQHRGDRIEDGLITVEYEFEQERPVITTTTPYWPKGVRGFEHPQYYDNTFFLADNSVYSNSVHDGQASMDWSDGASTGPVSLNALSVTRSHAVPQNTAGITAPGSHNTQQFTTSSWYMTDPNSKASMTIELKGEVESDDINVTVHCDGSITASTTGSLHINASTIGVQAPVTIKTKVECTMCGSEYKAGTKFCSECGASLKLY